MSVVAAAAGGAISGYVFASDERRKTAWTTWTTGYTPSVKWDWNWDRLVGYFINLSLININLKLP